MPARGPLIVLFLAAVTALSAADADAELTQRGDLFLSFNGGISPQALPRRALAPIAVTVAGRIRTLGGTRPPALRHIAIALNRGAHLDTAGLPVCPASRIRSTTHSAALTACRAALIGRGSFAAAVAFPEQAAFPSHGTILAFNSITGCSGTQNPRLAARPSRSGLFKTALRRPGRVWPSRSRTQEGRQGERKRFWRGDGRRREQQVAVLMRRDPRAADRGRRTAPCHSRPAILVHAYGTNPAPITRLITFHIHHGSGTFGTTLTAALPPSVYRWGYLKRFSLVLRRSFLYRSRERSYLSAACAALPGFGVALFPFARATFAFADGRTLTSTVTRSCRVRR